ncbi:MAG: sigma-54 interaction domain-containing protein [Candidatus Methylomirabilia bacterium]
MARTGSGGPVVQEIPEIILNKLPSGILFCDTDCTIRFINRTYANYLGVTQEEVIGKLVTDYIPGSRIQHVLETGLSELGFKCSVGEGKEKKILIVNRIPVSDTDGCTIGVISQSLFGDIGELKDLSERLELLEKKVISYREKIMRVLSPKYSLADIRGDTPEILMAKEFVVNYAKTDWPVLLVGATGTGKELFSNALHLESQRHKGPFVSINCAAIPQDLLESELLGYAPGAFTGAQKEGKMGQIELANKGTLFLDEIGDMPLHAQVKLLRVLEENIVYRLGSVNPTRVDFRLIAATNRDLKQMIREGKFREELYYRLNTMIICIPTLRDRRQDIPVLARHFLDRTAQKHVSFSEKALLALMHYDWPGNVRELKNVIARATSLCKGDVIDVGNLPAEILNEPFFSHSGHGEEPRPSFPTLAGSEEKLILAAIEESHWNMTRTAKLLGISRATLYEKMKKLRILRPCKGQ